MARDTGTQERILSAIVDRLIDRVPEFTRSTCFMSDESIPYGCPPSEIFCTVNPSDGTFDDAMFSGGGEETVCEHTLVAVNVFTAVQGDSAGHSEYSHFSPERGILTRFKPKILRALLKGWEMQYQGDYITRDMLRAQRCSFRGGLQQPRGGPYYSQLSLTFSISFDWDLS